jgi:class 3 adenylate cyclase/tetratricopeptide (TPR) repeat protein
VSFSERVRSSKQLTYELSSSLRLQTDRCELSDRFPMAATAETVCSSVMVVCTHCGAENPDGFRFCGQCASPLNPEQPPRELRRVVTALFCDVTGSTALGEQLDPEVLRGVMNRYFEVMRETIERHGGTVEKFIGDAVMAVFGIPRLHEDDALRAVRAAAEIRDRLPGVAAEVGVALRFRTGVNTGPVLMGEGENLATGDAINVAARLEQSAAPGEIVIGPETMSLVKGAVEVGEQRLLELKGKSERVPAYPLVRVTGAPERVLSTPMVGRENELQHLRVVFNQTVRDRSCRLFTVLGSAGVGKSRLVAEFRSGLQARVVRGQCLPYGEGITYWPVVEALKELGSLPAGDAARPLRSLLGETDVAASAGEIAWGFRKLLEQEAQAQPLVLILDDLHWAEETLLDLVEHVADLSRDAPLLLLCMARPELLERRAAWGGGKWNATTVLLEPLDTTETELLLSELGGAPAELRQRIVQVAEGNPLFVQEMLALVRLSPTDDVEVPPTIQALLAARLDQLDPAERTVLERGSVEGRSFHRGGVLALADGDGPVDQQLLTLVRKELLRPDPPVFEGDDAYRFRHLLIRDAAYDALPKAVRADLHRRFADWVAQHGDELIELDEILGYHLEQAARYRAELGRADQELAIAAGERLARSGRRALWRGDHRAAAGLLERALTLTRPHRLDVNLEVALAQALETSDIARAAAVADGAAERAAIAGNEAGAAVARSVAATMRAWEGVGSPEEPEALGRRALELVEEAGDDDDLAAVWRVIAMGALFRNSLVDCAEALEKELRYARRAGHAVVGSRDLGVPLALGPLPVIEAMAKLEEAVCGQPHPVDQLMRGVMLAMLGSIAEAWELAVPADERIRELGLHPIGSAYLGVMAQIVDDHEAAERYFRATCEALEERGSASMLSTFAPELGLALCALDRHEEAEPLAAKGRELGDAGDARTQDVWRQVQALVLSARGEHDEAERLAREAVEFASRSDSPLWRGRSLDRLAEILERAGQRDEALAYLARALSEYERKPIVPLARRARERIAVLNGSRA